MIMNYRTVIGFGEKNVKYLLERYSSQLHLQNNLLLIELTSVGSSSGTVDSQDSASLLLCSIVPLSLSSIMV